MSRRPTPHHRTRRRRLGDVRWSRRLVGTAADSSRSSRDPDPVLNTHLDYGRYVVSVDPSAVQPAGNRHRQGPGGVRRQPCCREVWRARRDSNPKPSDP